MQVSRSGVALVALAIATAACSDSNSLGPATDPNIIDTVTIYALQGTPITSPSGFSVADRIAVRTDQSSAFDFAFNIDNSGQPVFLPLFVLGLSGTTANPGLKATTKTFDEITLADRDNYVTQDTVAFSEGDRFMARSRVVCTSLSVPRYGKIEVLSVDPIARSVTFRYLIDVNCGYVGLEPGIPEE